MARFDPVTRQFLVYEGKDSPSPPQAPAVPDPKQTISAQAAATPSTYTPYGSVVYSGDPNVAGSFKATETLSPDQQAILDARNKISTALLGNAQGQISGLPTTPFEASPVGSNFQYNGIADPTAQAVFKSQQQLLDPVFARQQTNLEQDLANKGIPLNSDAFNEAQRNLTTNQNQTEQGLAASTAANSFNRALATNQENEGTQQQNLNNQLTARQQQFNEIAQILGGNMQSQPQSVASPNVNPLAAIQQSQNAANTAYQGQMNAYNQQIASNNANMSGLFGLGSAALLAAAPFTGGTSALLGGAGGGASLAFGR